MKHLEAFLLSLGPLPLPTLGRTKAASPEFRWEKTPPTRSQVSLKVSPVQ